MIRLNVATTSSTTVAGSKEQEKAMVWNPQQYLKFSGHRLRPAVDLLMRIPDFPVRSVADLGAGAGNVTRLIKERWPDAAVVGVEGSAEMVGRRKESGARVEWLHQDLGSWQPARKYDVIYSNAALHWLPDHDRLFPLVDGKRRTRRYSCGADAAQFRSAFAFADRGNRIERPVAQSSWSIS